SFVRRSASPAVSPGTITLTTFEPRVPRRVEPGNIVRQRRARCEDIRNRCAARELVRESSDEAGVFLVNEREDRHGLRDEERRRAGRYVAPLTCARRRVLLPLLIIEAEATGARTHDFECVRWPRPGDGEE